MKTQNSVSRKIWILHKINKKLYFKHKFQASEKYVHFYALNTWLGLLLHKKKKKDTTLFVPERKLVSGKVLQCCSKQ